LPGDFNKPVYARVNAGKVKLEKISRMFNKRSQPKASGQADLGSKEERR